ncbi:MAG: biotin--[acetyl-CoA-carboxylase] ligase [Acutalibacteraceae bacterium]|nr:biotin--[acetyl-CoA-carboxylase] ligase [Acutalibacteraceae bacterium]
MVDIINTQNILELLDNNLKNKIKLLVLEKATSTNTFVKELASENDEGFVVVAGEQTAGRGRMGRSFFSPGDSGVYMSLLLKPEIKPEDAVQITTAAAVSVCKALESLEVYDSKIKWVNDIYICNRKVCGILTESSFNSQSGMLDFAVLGIGINIYESQEGFPDEIKDIAGAVFSERKENMRNRFIAGFLNEFFNIYKKLYSKNHLKEYKEKNFVLGREINIIQGDNVRVGKAIDIDDNCNLVVELPDGTTDKLYYGEISVRIR